jgi:hypothetical protein
MLHIAAASLPSGVSAAQSSVMRASNQSIASREATCPT